MKRMFLGLAVALGTPLPSHADVWEVGNTIESYDEMTFCPSRAAAAAVLHAFKEGGNEAGEKAVADHACATRAAVFTIAEVVARVSLPGGFVITVIKVQTASQLGFLYSFTPHLVIDPFDARLTPI